ncbi:MAG TPA: PRC-barrel domain-containing protein [Candidatus Paceibacterota bacterium]|jgi:uncharacterized protein YrrD
MYKGKDMIGKPVVNVATGEMIDKVRDVFFDAAERRVLGFLVDEGGLLASARVLPFASADVIGPDGILVSTDAAIVRASEAPHGTNILNENNVVVGTKIMTEDGKDLGTINDFFFEETTGAIEGYEVTGGLFADAVSGKSYLPSPLSFRIGRDVAFVPAETETLIEQQTGGLAAMMARTQDTMQSTRRDLESRTPDLTDAVKRAWERAKQVTAEVTGRTEEKIEEKRVEAALGRPVTRVILDRDDTPILNTGDIITNEAVAKARERGVLNMLLSSVYTAGPEFSSDELKTKPGEQGI